MCYFRTLSLGSMIRINNIWFQVFTYFPLAGIWVISCLAETNRTPFDFAEGESELVSGFNIEYGRVGFALIFIAEYGRIVFLSIITTSFFISHNTNTFYFYFMVRRIVRIWVWVRTTFPRYRYDKLINIAWKIFLPLSLILLCIPLFYFL